MRDKKPRVLIIDDNHDVLAYVDHWLRMYGFTTRIASGGIDGLRLADDDPPDIILLDLSMPGMDGFEVARELAGREWRDKVVLVAHTAYADESTRTRAAQSGFDRFLPKPGDPRVVAHSLRAWAPAGM